LCVILPWLLRAKPSHSRALYDLWSLGSGSRMNSYGGGRGSGDKRLGETCVGLHPLLSRLSEGVPGTGENGADVIWPREFPATRFAASARRTKRVFSASALAHPLSSVWTAQPDITPSTPAPSTKSCPWRHCTKTQRSICAKAKPSPAP